MARARQSADYRALKPASERASIAARGASKKSGTRCEVLLRKALWRLGLRYRLTPSSLPGKPDIVLPRHRVVIFCDGDFWHGRNLEQRLAKLRAGHNAAYWIAKVTQNVARDARRNAELAELGWLVLRAWETDILADAAGVAARLYRELERNHARAEASAPDAS